MSRKRKTDVQRVVILRQKLESPPKPLRRGCWVETPTGLFLACPKCGTRIALCDHRVDFYGRVYPVVTCRNVRCEWQEPIRLDNYGDDPNADIQDTEDDLNPC